MESRARGTGHRETGTGVLEWRARGHGELDTKNVASRGAGQAGARLGEQPPVLGGAGTGCGGPQRGGSFAGAWARTPRNLFGRCRLREAAAATGLTSAHPGPPAPGSERGHCPALAESVRSHCRSGAAKANTAPRRRYVSGWGGPRRGTAPGLRTGPPTLSPRPPGTGHLPPRLAQPLASLPPAPSLSDRAPASLSRVPARQAPGFRGAEWGAHTTASPSAPPPPTPGSIAPRPSPRATVRHSRCALLLPAAALRCLSLSLPASPEATPTVRSNSPLATGPRPGPGRGRGLSRAGGVAGRTGWSSRPAAAACRGHCRFPKPSPVGGTDTRRDTGVSWCRWHRLFGLKTADTTRAIGDPLGCACSGLPHAARTVEGLPQRAWDSSRVTLNLSPPQGCSPAPRLSFHLPHTDPDALTCPTLQLCSPAPPLHTCQFIPIPCLQSHPGP